MLKEISFFASMAESDLRRIAEIITVREYAKGAAIVEELTEAERFFVIYRGKIEISKKFEGFEEFILSVQSDGDFFGEMALLDDRPRSATAVAERRSRVLVVDRPSFESMILQNGRFALKIIKVLAERIRRSNDQVSELIETMPKERISRGMADFAMRAGERIHDGSYKVSVAGMSAWINGHLGVPLDELEAAIFRLVKAESISYSKAKDHLLLPEAFVRTNDRRAGEAPDRDD